METFSALLALCAGNSPVTGEFPTQRPMTRSFCVFFELRLNKWLSKQSLGWWFEMPSCSLWRNCNEHFRKSNLSCIVCYVILPLQFWIWFGLNRVIAELFKDLCDYDSIRNTTTKDFTIVYTLVDFWATMLYTCHYYYSVYTYQILPVILMSKEII